MKMKTENPAATQGRGGAFIVLGKILRPEPQGRQAISFDLNDIKCGQCRKAGRGLFQCSKRRDYSCEFVEYSNTRIQALIWIGIIPGFLALISLGKTHLPVWLPFAIFAIPFGLWITSSSVFLYNARSHARLKRTTIAGVELKLTVTPGESELVPIQVQPGQNFTYPPSIGALSALPDALHADTSEATSLFRAALIELMANGVIEFRKFKSYVFEIWDESPQVVNDYVVTPISKTIFRQRSNDDSMGNLDLNIVNALFQAEGRSKEMPGGFTVYDLVRAVYGSDVSKPSEWLAELVARNAEDKNLGQIAEKGRFKRKKFEWDVSNANRLKIDVENVQKHSRQLALDFPDFS